MVEVVAADGRPRVVDDRRLGVEHRVPPQEEAHARPEGPVVKRLARELHGEDVAPLRDHDADVDAAADRGAQRPPEAEIGHEVRVRDVQVAPRGAATSGENAFWFRRMPA